MAEKLEGAAKKLDEMAQFLRDVQSTQVALTNTVAQAVTPQ